jgi:hypothetical protein
MLTLEQIGAFHGIPVIVDGARLTESQALLLARTVERLESEASHSKERALELSLRAFRASFTRIEGGWVARENIPLGKNRGRLLRHSFLREDGGL